MTPKEQAIIDAIWGDDAEDIDNAILNSIFTMADLAASRAAAGKIIIVPETDTLH